MSDGHLAIEAAFHGHGIALGDSLTSITLLGSGRLVKPLEQTILAPRSFYLVWRKEARRSPLVAAFRTWAFAEVHR
jgi:LysR family glycine cleavage system transcriptional activator